MIVPCAGHCGRRLYVATPEAGRVYLCARCWRAFLSTMFDLVRRGREVFTARVPADEELS
jgi:hypothetical protein